MKVKVIQSYTDTEFNKNMIVGTEFEVSIERANKLIARGFVISLEAIVVEKQTRNRKK